MKITQLPTIRAMPQLVFIVLYLLLIDASAAGLSVTPVRTYLSPQQPRQAIELHNPGDKAVLVEIENFLWQQVEGKNQLIPTQDILTVPPVFTVASGKSQIIRVGFRHRPEAAKELSYRIILSQVPDQVTPDQGINVILRMSLPVFYTPGKTDAIPEWSLSVTGDELQLKLHNAGLKHLQIKKIELYLPHQPDIALAEIEGAGYVLPDSSKRWSVKLKQALSSQELLIKMATTRGDLENTVTLSR